MFCKKCGKQLPEGAQFCGACGTRLQQESIPYTAPVNKTPTMPSAKPASGKKPLPVKKLLVPLLAVAAVILVVVLVSALFGGKTVWLQTEYVSSTDANKTTYSMEYDEEGRLLSYEYSYKYDSDYSYLGEWGYSWEYTYEDGRITEAEFDGDTSFELEYTYDKDGLLESVESKNFEGEVKCDKEGRVLEIEIEGDKEVSAEFAYHKNGMLAEVEYKNGYIKVSMTFHEDGKVLESIRYWNGKKNNSTEYEYDDEGRMLLHRNCYYSEGKETSSITRTYEYDKQGNWVGYTVVYTDEGDKLTVECEVEGDKSAREVIIIDISGDRDELGYQIGDLEEDDTLMEEEYDEHGNRVERVTYGNMKQKETWEYEEYKGSRGYHVPNINEPMFFQFLQDF